MIENIENRITDFKYTTSKINLTLSLFAYYLFKGDIKRSDEDFEKFLSFIEEEPIPVARSKRYHESIKSLLKYSENERIRTKIKIIIEKMKPSFFYLDAKIEELARKSVYLKESCLNKDIKELEKDLENNIVINFLTSLLKIFKPKRQHSQNFEIDQNSFDTLYIKFVTTISKIGSELEIEDLFDLSFKNIKLIKLKLYKEEALKNVINNYYRLANRLSDSELVKQIFKQSKTIENPTYWAETLNDYSINLKKEKKFQIIEKILDLIIKKAESMKGEFSRVILLKESLKVATNLDDEKKVFAYIKKIEALNNAYQGHFSSLLVKLQLIETFYNIKSFEKSRILLKEVIKNAFIINEDELFINICQKIIGILPKYKNLIDNEISEYFILKINELKNPLLKAHLLLLLAEKINENPDMIEKINQILEKINKPYFSHNILYYNHIYPISKFILLRNFKTNDDLGISELDALFNNLRSHSNKCSFLLEALKQFKMRKQSKHLVECSNKFFEELDKINNEFEKKEVMVKFIELI